MAAANYSSTKTEIDEYEHVRRMEERHVELAPEGEREEVRQIFQAKGFHGEALASAVEVITERRERWIDTMMTEEHGLPPVTRSPVRSALFTFLAFSVCGCVPLAPYALHFPEPLLGLDDHDRAHILRHRLAAQPLVADALVAGGNRDLCHRNGRGPGRLCRRRRLATAWSDPTWLPQIHTIVPPCAPMAIREPSFTLGIEEEYLLVDKESRDLAPEPPPALLAKCEEALRGQVSPEFLRSQIEVGTRVCHSMQEARDELVQLRRTVGAIAGEFGLAPIAASTHPFAKWSNQQHTDKERYNVLAEDLQQVARRLVICGMHVHVGIEDDDLRIDLLGQAAYFLPHLLALSTSSPFWQGNRRASNPIASRCSTSCRAPACRINSRAIANMPAPSSFWSMPG